MNVEELLKQAAQKLQVKDYAGAREDYRTAAMMEEPSYAILTDLAITENSERLNFRRKLRAKYPNSLGIWLVEANLTVRTRQAMKLYEEMLEIFSNDNRSEVEIRLDRIGAACNDGQFEKAVDDFIRLWRMGESYEPARKLRPILLKKLVREVQDVQGITSLKVLITDETLPKAVQSLIENKILELEALEEAIQEMK